MLIPVASNLRALAASMATPEGDIQHKMYVEPKEKPPRRNPSVQNKSNRTDYSKNYMRDYRQHGKDYQRMPDEFKKRRREQRKKQKEGIKASDPLRAHLLNQEVKMWQRTGMPEGDFEFICNRRGFTEDEQNILIEDLCDLNLLNLE